MGILNFKHLRYFWAVAHSGSIARASEQLHVTPQSISTQLRELDDSLDAKLLRRAGRGLELTDIGRRVLSYADRIFGLGDELLDAVRSHDAQAGLPLRVGVADSVQKSVSCRVLLPTLEIDHPVRLVCREGRLSSLLAELAVHRLDLVIADRPLPGALSVRAYNHRLGASDVTVFGTAAQAAALTRPFPHCLDQAPFLLPGDDVAVRSRLVQWFDAHDLRPRIVGEFDDSALLKSFGQEGAGLFVAPTAIALFVCGQYGVVALGRIDAVVDELYAITTERRLRHPAILAICQAAQQQVFGAGAPPAPRSRPRGPAKRQR